MGSVEATAATDDEFTVLVTGFAPFKSDYPQNPSWEIARDLPAYLPARTKTAADGASASESAVDLPPVRIVVYPEAVRVNYQTVRALVPTLWDGGAAGADGADGAPRAPHPAGFEVPAKIDLMLHIGMAGPRLQYALERVGRRDGYTMRDVDGQLLGDTAADHDDPAWPWYGVPAALEPQIDLDDVMARWRRHVAAAGGGGGGGGDRSVAGAELRLSIDAGRYLCDFIFFSSLAHLYRRNRETGGQDPRYRRRRVAFLHVPAVAAPERIAAGRTLAVELIRALAESEVAARRAGRMGASEEAEDKPSAAASRPAAGADTAMGKWYRD